MRVVDAMCLMGVLGLVACQPPVHANGGADGDGDTDADVDEAVDCEPGSTSCDGDTLRQCNAAGDGWGNEQPCAAPTPTCVEGLGCTVCRPFGGDCEGDTPLTCSADGLSWERGTPCDTAAGQLCSAGYCSDPCSAAASSNSYIGCEYWAVDLPNTRGDGGHVSPNLANFDVVISNGSDSAEATVQVFFGGDETTPRLTTTVPPSSVRALGLNGQVPPEESSIDGTGVFARRSFHIVSSLPVTAYQFNPLNNTDAAYSNDASLLLPVNGLDASYIVTTGDAYPTETEGNPLGAFVTVVAIEDGTEVTVAPTVSIDPGSGLSGGSEITVTLNRFDVLNLESLSSDGAEAFTPGNGNLSGTAVRSTKNVAVLAGNVCGQVPYGPETVCCCDHMEEQMIPLSAWGKAFVVGRAMARRLTPGDEEPEYYRVTGGNPPPGAGAIHLSYGPFTPSGAPAELRQGQSVEFSSTRDFIVDADGPIMLTNFIVSSHVAAHDYRDTLCLSGPGPCSSLPYATVCADGYCQPVGDPSMTIVPPVEQFRSSYVFLAPDDYRFDAITILAPVGTVMSLDGAPVTEPATEVGDLGGVRFGAVRLLVGDGAHRLEADQEVGLLVYGMDDDVSYSYPGGLDLEIINMI